jgi:putative cell wall-binding protein
MAKKETNHPHRWSQRVTENSNALDLEPSVFSNANPRAVAESLKRSAETSQRRKGTEYQSAMSMLTFYMNRAGSKLAAGQRRVLTQAKTELRRLYGK